VTDNVVGLPSQRRSPGEVLSDELERWTDIYATTCDLEAEADGILLDAASEAWNAASDVAVTARQRHVDYQPQVVAARKTQLAAFAARRKAQAHVEEMKARLMAALSHAKAVRGQT